MAKSILSFVCQNCGAAYNRWQGKCESCGEWNTIIEEAAALGVGGAATRRGAAGRPFPLEDLSGATKSEPRLVTGIGELDRVAGAERGGLEIAVGRFAVGRRRGFRRRDGADVEIGGNVGLEIVGRGRRCGARDSFG